MSPWAREVRLRVSDAAGATDTATATVRVDTAPPRPVIEAPVAGPPSRWVRRSGFGWAEVGSPSTPAPAPTWGVDLLHCMTESQCHRHLDLFSAPGADERRVHHARPRVPGRAELRLGDLGRRDGDGRAARRLHARRLHAVAAGVTDVELVLAGGPGPAPLTLTTAGGVHRHGLGPRHRDLRGARSRRGLVGRWRTEPRDRRPAGLERADRPLRPCARPPRRSWRNAIVRSHASVRRLVVGVASDSKNCARAG